MHQSVLSLDLGLKRIGVALNPYGQVILELPTIHYLRFDELISALKPRIANNEVSLIVVGRVRLNNQKMIHLLERLKKTLDHITFVEIDETLTTKEAERRLGKKMGDTDAYAARLILEQYLNESS